MIWVGSLLVAELLRYQDTRPVATSGLATIAIVAIVLQLIAGMAFGLYRVRWRVGSFEQIRALTKTVITVSLVTTVVDLLPRRHAVPLTAAIGGGMLALLLSFGLRSLWRLNWERRLRPAEMAERAVVFGAGEAGAHLIQALLRDPTSPYVPVALLDDDPAKRNQAIRHLRVRGDRASLAQVAKAVSADTLIVAIPSADSALIRELSERAFAAEMSVKVLPPVPHMLSDSVSVADIRPVTEEDLLGRRPVDTEVAAIAGYLTGRRVLVTGAGGSIGSELCRQIHRYSPARLVMLDRDESGLHQVQLSIDGHGLLDDRNLVVCNIRDRSALAAVFDEHRPEVVFHAAALKHLPLLEMWPAEAVKTNVVGTANVLSVAAERGVERFVNISTDKAANPESVLGFTKRIAERFTATMASAEAAGTYISVRFGNVLGSRGSVLTAFRAQIRRGGPVTVTHPDVTRYFMTVEEAVELVIQAGAVGHAGEVLVLDMGEPVSIAEVAQRLVLESGRPIEIEYTGLRPGEKLQEDLFGREESDTRPKHPLISHVPVPPLSFEVISRLLSQRSPDGLRSELRRACAVEDPTGLPSEIGSRRG